MLSINKTLYKKIVMHINKKML